MQAKENVRQVSKYLDTQCKLDRDDGKLHVELVQADWVVLRGPGGAGPRRGASLTCSPRPPPWVRGVTPRHRNFIVSQHCESNLK